MPGNEESCGDEESKRAVVVPMVVGVIDVRVDPPAIVVAVGVEHVRIAVGMYEAPSISISPPSNTLRLYRIRDL